MKRTKEYYESFIGKTFKGFKFEHKKHNELNWSDERMGSLVGENLLIEKYDSYHNTFDSIDSSYFPADLVIEQILKEENPNELLDKFIKGEIAILNDGVINDLYDVLKISFPKYPMAIYGEGIYLQVIVHPRVECRLFEETKLPCISVKELLHKIKQEKNFLKALEKGFHDRYIGREFVATKGENLGEHIEAHFGESLTVTEYIENRDVFGLNNGLSVKAKELMLFLDKQNRTFNPEKHYFNEPKTFRSLFELSHILELNEWEFDILKRLVRCRKKGQFAEDLQKIKNTVDIYKEEYNEK